MNISLYWLYSKSVYNCRLYCIKIRLIFKVAILFFLNLFKGNVEVRLSFSDYENRSMLTFICVHICVYNVYNVNLPEGHELAVGIPILKTEN